MSTSRWRRCSPSTAASGAASAVSTATTWTWTTSCTGRIRLGPVVYERRASGPDTDRRIVGLGFGEIQLEGVPLVWLQRAANPQYGRERYTVELLCPDRAVTDRFLARTHALMGELSLLRGQVVSFAPNPFDYHAAGAELTFLHRPDVSAEAVILPEGVRERVVRHVVGIGAQREALRPAGQHLKRGVLLYGPPGTGKTHLVRHLLSATPAPPRCCCPVARSTC